MTISHVVVFAVADPIFFEDPFRGPAGTNVIDAPIGPIEKNDGGPVVGSFGIEESLGNRGPHSVAEHGIIPVVSAFSEGECGMVWDPRARKEIVFKIVVVVFSTKRKVEGFLFVTPPVVFSANTDTSVD